MYDDDSGPHLKLIQLFPSSTVADGVRLNTGWGSPLVSMVPGGTCQPAAPPNSGGTREPLQYRAAKVGAVEELPG